MAITFPISGSTGVSAPGTTATSGAFSPTAGSVIWVFVGSNEVDDLVITNSGTALTWTSADSIEFLDADVYAEIFWAYNANAQSNITVTATGSSGTFFVKPVVSEGVNTTDPVGATGTELTGTNPFSANVYVSTVNNSRGIGMALDPVGAADSGSPTSTDGVFTSLKISSNDINAIAVAKAASTPTSGTNVPFNCSATGSSLFVFLGVEVLPGAASQEITPNGMATGEAFGTAKLNLQVLPTGITTGEALGTAQLNLTLTGTGIASAEAIGDAVVMGIAPEGIASAEAFGTPLVTYQQTVSPSGIASEEAVGVPEDIQIGYPQDVSPTGIESSELIVAPRVRLAKKLVLSTPSIQETPAGWGRLYSRYGIHRGISIVKTGPGVFYETRYPAQTLIEEVEKVYMGGHRHTITVAEAQELTTAGYGSYITLEDND